MNRLLDRALDEFGIKEIVGEEHNDRIVQYATDLGWEWIDGDETPWCSIFINWLAMKAGYERSNSAAARSWLKVGEKVDNPEKGDLVVFKRGNSSWKGHVAIYINEGAIYINVLGGNQNNQVNIKPYRKSSVLGFIRLRREDR